MTVFHRTLLLLAVVALGAPLVSADPLSKKNDVDFFREVPSRNLRGLATRSDGRLVAGPTFTDLNGPVLADLLWCIEPTADPTKFLIGTGPEGKVLELTLGADGRSYTTREIAKLGDPQVFALKRCANGTIVAGTSPAGGLYLLRDGKVAARVGLPVDSIFDLLPLNDATVLVATGNPGRIYRVDLTKFATAGVLSNKVTDARKLADIGVTVFGEIRDRNVRRLARLADGRIVAGSSPKGILYTFAADGGAPVILQENHDAEVTDLLPQPNGDLFATVVFSSSSGEGRMTPAGARSSGAAREKEPNDAAPAPVQVEKFSGRSALVWFPANGFPETLSSRSNTAFYRLARHGDLLVIAGGDAGELLGFDPQARLSLTFPGSVSAQLNGLLPLPGANGKFLALRNNTPGIGLVDFAATGAHEAETRRIDLGSPSTLGALRFNRVRNVTEDELAVDVRLSNGAEEAEGWGPWQPLKHEADGGWRAPDLRGRYVKIRVRLPAKSSVDGAQTGAQLDHASVFALPQNRRPLLQDFRVLSPGFGLVVSVDQPASPVVSLNQLLQPNSHDDDKHKGSFTNSQVVPQPGTQVVLWTVTDPDGDNVVSTFSIRRDPNEPWIDVAANTRDAYAQFDTSHLPDGIYYTRLVATETAPRPPADRLTQTFETDDLVIDHTPPEILQATAKRQGDTVTVSVHGRDALSLLDGADITFNNGVHETVEQPVDGVRDGREETFSFDFPIARISNATSVEVTLYDACGNSSSRRLTW